MNKPLSGIDRQHTVPVRNGALRPSLLASALWLALQPAAWASCSDTNTSTATTVVADAGSDCSYSGASYSQTAAKPVVRVTDSGTQATFTAGTLTLVRDAGHGDAALAVDQGARMTVNGNLVMRQTPGADTSWTALYLNDGAELRVLGDMDFRSGGDQGGFGLQLGPGSLSIDGGLTGSTHGISDNTLIQIVGPTRLTVLGPVDLSSASHGTLGLYVDGEPSIALNHAAITPVAGQATLRLGPNTSIRLSGDYRGVGQHPTALAVLSQSDIDIESAADLVASGSGGSGIITRGRQVRIRLTGGTITSGTDDGAGIYASGAPTAMDIRIDSGASIDSRASGDAIWIDTSSQVATTLDIAGTVKGAVRLQDSGDTVTLRAPADASALTTIEAAGGSDQFTALGSSLSVYSDYAALAPDQGVNLRNLENIQLNDAARVTLTGDLDTSANGSGPLGQVSIGDAGSTLFVQGAGSAPVTRTVQAHLSNSGTIRFNNLNTTLRIAGDYQGTAGSRIELETRLGGDDSPTDRLVIGGNTSGTSDVRVRNAGGAGAATANGIKIIQVDGQSPAGSFTMGTPVQAGSYEYNLFQGGSDDANDWYLRSQYVSTPAPPTPTPTPPIAVLGDSGGPVFRPAVPAYVLAQQDNAELGFASLGSRLHQRQAEMRRDPDSRTWGRLGGASLQLQGQSQFDLKQQASLIQFGHDLLSEADAGSDAQTHAGLMLGYGRSDSKLYNQDRARRGGLEAFTGTLDGSLVSLGGYYTRHGAQGSYIDLVAQLGALRNRFNDIRGIGATQRGKGLGLSVEFGRPMAAGESTAWQIEPQAQLSYQHQRYSSFSDSVSRIDGFSKDALRARVGTRLVNTSGFFFTADLLQDLIKGSAVVIGGSAVREKINSTPWLALGAGGRVMVAKNTALYGSLQLAHGLSSGTRKGAQAHVGLQSSW
jgi:outer membrane autotransporter protein